MTEYARSRSGAKKASMQLRKGDTFYTKVEVSKRHAPYEDSELLQRYTVTGTHPLMGGAMVGGHSVEGIVLREGPAYTTRPKGYRGVWEPAPQFFGPLELHGKKYDRPLNARELRNLENKVADDLADRYGKARAKREAKKAIEKQLAGAR